MFRELRAAARSRVGKVGYVVTGLNFLLIVFDWASRLAFARDLVRAWPWRSAHVLTFLLLPQTQLVILFIGLGLIGIAASRSNLSAPAVATPTRIRKGVLDFFTDSVPSAKAKEALDCVATDLGRLLAGPTELLRKLNGYVVSGSKRRAASMAPRIAKWHDRQIPHLRRCIDELARFSTDLCNDRIDQVKLVAEGLPPTSTLRGLKNDLAKSGGLRTAAEGMRSKLAANRSLLERRKRLAGVIGVSLEILCTEIERLDAVLGDITKAAKQEEAELSAALRTAFATEHTARFPSILDDPLAIHILKSFRNRSRYVSDVATEFHLEPWEAKAFLGRLHAATFILPIVEDSHSFDLNEYGLDNEGRKILHAQDRERSAQGEDDGSRLALIEESRSEADAKRDAIQDIATRANAETEMAILGVRLPHPALKKLATNLNEDSDELRVLNFLKGSNRASLDVVMSGTGLNQNKALLALGRLHDEWGMIEENQAPGKHARPQKRFDFVKRWWINNSGRAELDRHGRL